MHQQLLDRYQNLESHRRQCLQFHLHLQVLLDPLVLQFQYLLLNLANLEYPARQSIPSFDILGCLANPRIGTSLDV
jgi:hypothetical protein